MQTLRFPVRALLAAFLLGLAAVSRLSAQVEVTPVQPVQPVQPVAPVIPPATATTTTTTTTAVTQPATIQAAHVVEIQLAVSKGSVQAYFGRAARKEKVELGSAEIDIKLPSTSTVTKLASRDKTSEGSKKVTPDNPWAVQVPVNEPGRYVFNIVEWDDDPVVTAAIVKVDGQIYFSGRGSEDNINGWAVKEFGSHVVKSGSREIAFVLP